MGYKEDESDLGQFCGVLTGFIDEFAYFAPSGVVVEQLDKKVE